MTTTADPTLPPGTRLAHYVIRREIGVGAMGTVYEAHDTSLDRSVAVKVLKPQIAGDEAVVERFFREARAAARVNHPNLIHVYFVGREDGRPFFAMELVPGETLEEAVRKRGPFPLAEAVDDIVEAARGLAAAHAAGVIHRDVKPSNLIRGTDGVVRVGDFGLAKSMDADVNATGGGSLMGTPTFMSPEQFRGGEVDHRADIYALGLVAWFLLVGRPPFETQSLGQILHDQMNAPLPPAAKERPELPRDVDAVLRRLCEKDPANRPQTMNEAIELLETLRPRPIVLAPIFTRAAAFVADGVLATLLGVVTALLLVAVAQLLDPIHFEPADWVGDAIEDVLADLLPLLVFAATVLLPEVWYGTTIGKFLFGLRVVRTDGNRPGALPVVGRFLLRWPALVILPFAVVWDFETVEVLVVIGLQAVAFLAGVVSYFAKGERTLSDLVTKTRVAYRPAPGR